MTLLRQPSALFPLTPIISGKPVLNIAGLLPVSFFNDPSNLFFGPNLFRFLADLGHTVTVYIPYGEYRHNKASCKSLPFTIRSLPPSISRIARYASIPATSFFAREQQKHGYDIWHSAGDGPGSSLLEFVPKRCVRIAHVDNPPSLQNPGGSPVDALSTTLPDPSALAPLSGLSSDRIFAFPPAIHGERMQRAFDTVAIRRSWSVMPGTTLVLSVLPAPDPKRLHKIGRLCAALPRTDFKWITAAPGMTAAVRALTEALPNRLITLDTTTMHTSMHADLRRFNAPPRPVLELFAAADLLVQPLTEHADRLPIIQAMGARLPVLASGGTNLKLLLSPDSPIMHCPEADTARIIHTLNELLDDSHQRRSLGRTSLEFAARFDWPCIARQYEAMYASVLRSH